VTIIDSPSGTVWVRPNEVVDPSPVKRWEATVGRPEIQKFAGALQGQRARKGIFITTSNFSKEAMDYVKYLDTKIILIDGERMAELMIDHNVGVSPLASYEIKKIDTDYFLEE